MSEAGTPGGAPLDYRTAGVDIDAADDAKHRIGRLVQSTLTAGARGAFGGFGGMFKVPTDVPNPILVSSADGVGTKLKVAIEAGRHDTVGHDLVNHCVNDILVQGASPLFFLDYVAFGVLEPPVVEAIVAGVAAGCRENGCALLGGETAEMPGFYQPGEYDLAGFSVGIVKNSEALDGRKVRAGDVLIGLPSTGFHSNGFSLIRKVLDTKKLLKKYAPRLLTPTRIYVKDVNKLRAALKRSGQDVLALAHITGSGIPGNLPRVLPKNLGAVVLKDSWKTPPLMRELQKLGGIPEADMWDSFNMGVGMIAVVRPAAVRTALRTLKGSVVIGEVVKGRNEVVFR